MKKDCVAFISVHLSVVGSFTSSYLLFGENAETWGQSRYSSTPALLVFLKVLSCISLKANIYSWILRDLFLYRLLTLEKKKKAQIFALLNFHSNTS